MTIEKRIKHLEEEHHTLDKKINGMESTGVFDDEHLTKMKKQRLHIKEEIVKLQAMLERK
jgi:hypothetical protein